MNLNKVYPNDLSSNLIIPVEILSNFTTFKVFCFSNSGKTGNLIFIKDNKLELYSFISSVILSKVIALIISFNFAILPPYDSSINFLFFLLINNQIIH
jgi:hypothetical protein